MRLDQSADAKVQLEQAMQDARDQHRLLAADQAKVQEQLSAAMSQLSPGMSEDVPSLDEVRDKIEQRLAGARAVGELRGSDVSIRVLEVEHALQGAEAHARLGVMRSQLRLPKSTVAATIE